MVLEIKRRRIRWSFRIIKLDESKLILRKLSSFVKTKDWAGRDWKSIIGNGFRDRFLWKLSWRSIIFTTRIDWLAYSWATWVWATKIIKNKDEVDRGWSLKRNEKQRCFQIYVILWYIFLLKL